MRAGADDSCVANPCRYCGAESRRRLEDGLEVCDRCANSPLCDACLHPRGAHGQVFVNSAVRAGCGYESRDFQSLSSVGCACDGFRPLNGAFADAFAIVADPDPLELGLRLA